VPDIISTEVVTASAIDSDGDGTLDDVVVAGARVTGADTSGDGEIDEVVVEEFEIEVVDE
jgi:hypothetical protein